MVRGKLEFATTQTTRRIDAIPARRPFSLRASWQFSCAAFFDGFLGALLRLAPGEVGADVFRRMPDGGHRGFQFGRRDLEFLRPVADFVRLAHRDPRPVGGLVLLQLDVGFDVLGGASRFLDGGLQFGRRDLEFLRPIGDLVRLAQCDQRHDRPRRASSCCPPSRSPVVLRKYRRFKREQPNTRSRIRTDLGCGDP